MAMMVLQIVPFIGEGTVAFLYVRTRFGWEVEEFSQYSSIVSAIGIVGKPALQSPKSAQQCKAGVVAQR